TRAACSCELVWRGRTASAPTHKDGVPACGAQRPFTRVGRTCALVDADVSGADGAASSFRSERRQPSASASSKASRPHADRRRPRRRKNCAGAAPGGGERRREIVGTSAPHLPWPRPPCEGCFPQRRLKRSNQSDGRFHSRLRAEPPPRGLAPPDL